MYLARKPNDELVQREPIFFAHAESVGYSRTGKWIGSDLPGVLIDYASAHKAVRSSYGADARFRARDFQTKVEMISGYRTIWHLGDAGTGGERLDFFDARAKDIVGRLEQAGVELVPLSDLLEIREVEHPEPSRTGEYEFAYAEWTTGEIRRRGMQQVAYSPAQLWVVRTGDLIVSGIDTVHGAVGVAGPEVDGLVMSKEMFAYRARGGVDVNLSYLAEVVRAPIARDLLYGLVTGTSNRNRLTEPTQLLGLPVPRPPARPQQDSLASTRRKAEKLRGAASLAAVEAATAAAATWSIDIGESVVDAAERSSSAETQNEVEGVTVSGQTT
jgi:hypothetical protein